jgi:hypothetical protein
MIGSSNGEAVIFAPLAIGIPDDAVGYGHFVGQPVLQTYNGYGMPICPVFPVGGGWWWMDNRSDC